MSTFLRGVALLGYAATAAGASLGGLQLLDTFARAESAPQQAAGAAMALGLAVLPYVAARSLHEAARAMDEGRRTAVAPVRRAPLPTSTAGDDLRALRGLGADDDVDI